MVDVIALREQLQEAIAAGNALARSLGHQPQCPKVSRQLPCVCNAGMQQAQALDDWQHLVEEIRNETPKV